MIQRKNKTFVSYILCLMCLLLVSGFANAQKKTDLKPKKKKINASLESIVLKLNDLDEDEDYKPKPTYNPAFSWYPMM